MKKKYSLTIVILIVSIIIYIGISNGLLGGNRSSLISGENSHTELSSDVEAEGEADSDLNNKINGVESLDLEKPLEHTGSIEEGIFLFEDKESGFFVKERKGYYISKYGKIKVREWEKFAHVEHRYKDVIEFLTEVDYLVESISQYLNRPNWLDEYKEKQGEAFDGLINLKFLYGNISFVVTYDYFILEVNINADDFKEGIPPLAHELAHLIARNGSHLALTEGLAQVIQGEFSNMDPSIHLHEIITPYSKFYLTEENQIAIDAISKLEELELDFYGDSFELVDSFYTLSYSFVKYLIDEYGIDKFMEIYYAEDLNSKYEEIYGKNAEQLCEEWTDYVNEYIFDWEEYYNRQEKNQS